MKHLKLLSSIVLAALLTQCYPGGPDYTEELDLVYTIHDDTKNFKEEKTYFIDDQIVIIDNDFLSGDAPNYVKPAYADPYLKIINDNMAANGWTKVDKTVTPDVVLTSAALEATTINTYYPYWGYGGYWDYWGYYGWYYPYPVTTSYTTGTVILNMVDPQSENGSGKKRVIWTNLFNGLLNSSTADFALRANKGVNQAFKQSPYLKIN